jgi:hypothetical protein
MTLRLVVGIAAVAVGSACGVASTLARVAMVDKVNEKLSKEEQFAVLGWYWSKQQRLHREYKRLYPDGRLLIRIRSLLALAIACLLVCGWSLGVFPL